MNKSKRLSGPAMRDRLLHAGIEVQQVTRRMDSGHYVAEFYTPGMEQPIESSQSYAQRLRQKVNGLQIINCDDTIADWREGKPIIWATVTFADTA